MQRVDAPWTDDQVASLNAYQQAGYRHPFTGSEGLDGHRVTLIATSRGWVERVGGPVVQTWAHEEMTNWKWRMPEFEAK
jgi:hypothetical protein